MRRRWRDRHKTTVTDVPSAMEVFIDGWMTSVKNDPWGAGSDGQATWTVGADDLIFNVTFRQWTDAEVNDLMGEDQQGAGE